MDEDLRESRITICVINTRITIRGVKKIQYITRARQGRNKWHKYRNRIHEPGNAICIRCL